MNSSAGQSRSSAEIVRSLEIGSPKRNKSLQTGWEGFFPYYAGYPEGFATNLLKSADLGPSAVVMDPWNGSGTTTYSAWRLGYQARGLDINPAMVVIAHARLLAPSEADSLRPLAATIINHLRSTPDPVGSDDPLNMWFAPGAAAIIRAIESELRGTLVGDQTLTPNGVVLGRLSGIAATLYVALFTACRALATKFRSTNPTWIRIPRDAEDKIAATRLQIVRMFSENVRGMAAALAKQSGNAVGSLVEWNVEVADTAAAEVEPNSIDFILSSPPYCTRIDYAVATRIELAVLHPLLDATAADLAKRMTGSTHAPRHEIEASPLWGGTCIKFLERVRTHPSKASAGYYLRTHLDYFDKMARSMAVLHEGLRSGGIAALVVQDSYYKDVHNDLPTIIGEMGTLRGLRLIRAEKFNWEQSMARINRHTRAYNRPSHATETVLCFVKE